MVTGEQRVEWMALDEIARWPRNPKLHRHDVLDASMKRFGFVQPPLVDEGTGQLVAGHGRLETLQQMRAAGGKPPTQVRVRADGMWLMPVLRGLTFESAQEAEAYLLADNRTSEIGGWDDLLLTEMTTELVDTGGMLEGVGWTDQQLTDMRAAAAPPPTLDQVAAKHGEHDAEAAWPEIRLRVPVEVYHRWSMLLKEMPGATDGERLSAAMDAAERGAAKARKRTKAA